MPSPYILPSPSSLPRSGILSSLNHSPLCYNISGQITDHSLLIRGILLHDMQAAFSSFLYDVPLQQCFR